MSCLVVCASALFFGKARADEVRAWDLAVAAGVGVVPRYSGAAESTARLRVWADAEYRTGALGSFALDSGSLTTDPELRWNVIDRPEVGFGPLVGYRFGRGDSDPGFASGGDGSSRLQGLPIVGAAVDAGVQGHVLLFRVPVFAQVRAALSGAQGTLVNLGLYLPLLSEGAFSFTALPTVRWANARQMRAMYGVSPGASAASGFAAYDPGSGLENAALELAGDWRMGKSGHLVASLAYERLLDRAAGSPLVQERNQLSVLGGVAWDF